MFQNIIFVVILMFQNILFTTNLIFQNIIIIFAIIKTSDKDTLCKEMAEDVEIF